LGVGSDIPIIMLTLPTARGKSDGRKSALPSRANECSQNTAVRDGLLHRKRADQTALALARRERVSPGHPHRGRYFRRVVPSSGAHVCGPRNNSFSTLSNFGQKLSPNHPILTTVSRRRVNASAHSTRVCGQKLKPGGELCFGQLSLFLSLCGWWDWSVASAVHSFTLLLAIATEVLAYKLLGGRRRVNNASVQPLHC
jgi:hypothetical protein